MPDDAEKKYYYVFDQDGGEWTYVDSDMFINIRRFEDVVERSRTLVWYETEVKVAQGTKFVTQHANPEQIGRRFMMAEVFASQLQSVLAFSDDFYGFRVYQRRTPGIIIQNGELLANDSFKRPYYKLPTYDLIALYPDGSMKTFLAGSVDGETLMAQNVTDTWCFGPVLLSEGEIGQQVLEDRFEFANPRQAQAACYRYAKTLFREEQYEQASDLFEALGSFRESRAYLYDCKMAILRRDYTRAEELMEAGDCADATAQLQAAVNLLSRSEVYDKANAAFENGEYATAQMIFDVLGDYQNAKELVQEAPPTFTAKKLRDDQTTPKSDVFTAPDGTKHRYQIFKGMHTWPDAKAYCNVLAAIWQP